MSLASRPVCCTDRHWSYYIDSRLEWTGKEHCIVQRWKQTRPPQTTQCVMHGQQLSGGYFTSTLRIPSSTFPEVVLRKITHWVHILIPTHTVPTKHSCLNSTTRSCRLGSRVKNPDPVPTVIVTVGDTQTASTMCLKKRANFGESRQARTNFDYF